MRAGSKIGPFLIEKELGSGAMGAVFLARFKDTKQRVAIKIISPSISTNENALARFQREADILKQLRHPHIVRLLATGKYQKSPFYAMEFVEGESLDHVIARRDRLSWEEVVDLGIQLCDALQHAHDHGIVHRDLKPSNLMVLADNTVKLTDFGIAKDLDQTELTGTNCTVGTAAYMSPEQCKGERNITSQSDLYSMGVMFYELVTGRKPFKAESTMEMFIQHVNGTVERPSRYALEIPVWLDNLICQLLEKKPEDRPLNASMVKQSLSEIREKVEAQQSAGYDRARTKRKDRRKNQQELDEEDREAARALLRKRKKKKKVPFYTRGWFVALGLLVIAGGMGTLLYYTFFKPPALEYLHEEARDLMANKDLEGYDDALESPLAQFAYYYKESDDPLAKDLRKWTKEALAGRREIQMHIRWKRNVPTGGVDQSEENLARIALESEKKCQFEDAKKFWKRLAESKNHPDEDIRAWGLVGVKCLDQLTRLEKKIEFLQEKINNEEERVPKSENERIAFNALQLESKQEIPKAILAWRDLKDKSVDNLNQRMWFLMAQGRIKELLEKSSSPNKKTNKDNDESNEK